MLSIDRFLQKVGTPEIYDTSVFRYGKRATKTCSLFCSIAAKLVENRCFAFTTNDSNLREKLYFLQQNLCMFAFYRPRDSCFAASPVYDVIPA